MKVYTIIPIFFFMVGCATSTYDDIEEPQDNQGEMVTFQDVAFIFKNNCTACHSMPPQNDAPMSLTNYSEVKNAVENLGLLDRISRDEGEQGLMPLGGPRLPQQQIDLITKWNLDGLLEN